MGESVLIRDADCVAVSVGVAVIVGLIVPEGENDVETVDDEVSVGLDDREEVLEIVAVCVTLIVGLFVAEGVKGAVSVEEAVGVGDGD